MRNRAGRETARNLLLGIYFWREGLEAGRFPGEEVGEFTGADELGVAINDHVNPAIRPSLAVDSQSILRKHVFKNPQSQQARFFKTGIMPGYHERPARGHR